MFTPAAAHKITSVKLKLYRSGTPGTLTVSIRATDASGLPIGSDLCSGTTGGSTLVPSPSSGEWREISLGSGCNLSAGTKYAIVARAPRDISNQVNWRHNFSDGPMAAAWLGRALTAVQLGAALQQTTSCLKSGVFLHKKMAIGFGR